MSRPAATVLTVSSQVVWGHVGNSAIVPALQALGCEALALPTVLLAHHPGHGAPRGRVTPPEELAALADGLQSVGALGAVDAVLSGYLGLAQSAEVVAVAVERVRAIKPHALYLCDPVIGDDGRVYVREGVEEAIATRLLPLADIITPNHFELERLSGRPLATLDEAVAAARALIARGPRVVVVSSVRHPGLPPDRVATLAVTADQAWTVTTARLERVPRGSGDLLSALLLAHTLAGRTLPEALGLSAAAVFDVLLASVGQPEMVLVAQRQALTGARPLAVSAVD